MFRIPRVIWIKSEKDTSQLILVEGSLVHSKKDFCLNPVSSQSELAGVLWGVLLLFGDTVVCVQSAFPPIAGYIYSCFRLSISCSLIKMALLLSLTVHLRGFLGMGFSIDYLATVSYSVCSCLLEERYLPVFFTTVNGTLSSSCSVLLQLYCVSCWQCLCVMFFRHGRFWRGNSTTC